jgi:hypothetical protein
MFVSCTVFVLSGRGLWDGPIPRPEESYQLWCVLECDREKIKTLCTYCEQVGEGRATEPNVYLHFIKSLKVTFAIPIRFVFIFHLYLFLTPGIARQSYRLNLGRGLRRLRTLTYGHRGWNFSLSKGLCHNQNTYNNSEVCKHFTVYIPTTASWLRTVI